jgi:hypothetical protein
VAQQLVLMSRLGAAPLDRHALARRHVGAVEPFLVGGKDARQLPAFENVANLDQLPAKGFSVIALPMKIKGGSGGPLRIVAIR